jgi:hypothetical protein
MNAEQVRLDEALRSGSALGGHVQPGRSAFQNAAGMLMRDQERFDLLA